MKGLVYMKKLNVKQTALFLFLFMFFLLSGCGSSELEINTVAETAETEENSLENNKDIKDKEDKENLEKENIEVVFSENSVDSSVEDSLDNSIDNSVNASENSSSTTIFVYVCGAVNEEGVYMLPAGSRITDALDAAGGYAESALHGYLNLAEPLVDGQRVYFPYSAEEEELDMTAGAAGQSSNQGSGQNADAGAPDGAIGSETGNKGQPDGLVNINTAGVDELKTLSGIGDSRASDIVAYREANGPFGSIEEIMNVSGIGESIFNKIKPYITTE